MPPCYCWPGCCWSAEHDVLFRTEELSWNLPEEIEEAVHAVAAGRSLLSAAITLKLMEAVARPELSRRELEVLQFIASGRSNKEIGNVLYISELTVKGHVRSILEKLDAKCRSEAIAIAVDRGLLRAKL